MSDEPAKSTLPLGRVSGVDRLATALGPGIQGTGHLQGTYEIRLLCVFQPGRQDEGDVTAVT